MQYCKGEVVHLTLLFPRCKQDTVHTAVGDNMGSLVGRMVETEQGRVRLLLELLSVLQQHFRKLASDHGGKCNAQK